MRTDKKTTSIGIIGKGFVGTAVAHGFSHQTGYGADIRLELYFSEFENNEGYISIWVWSSITEDFTIKKCKFSMNNEETPELSFDSTIEEGLKDRVVTNFIAKWDKENDKILTHKHGYPQFYTQIFFEKGKKEIFLKTVLNDEEGISKISTCKKIEKFKEES